MKPGAEIALDLVLPAGADSRLQRAIGAGPLRRDSLTLTWHDGDAWPLAQAGRAMVAQRLKSRTDWRLERAWPATTAIAPPGTPPAILAEAISQPRLADLTADLPDTTAIASFAGRGVRIVVDGVAVQGISGRLRGAAGTQAVSRLRLAGPHAAVLALADRLADSLGAAVATTSLAQDALALAGAPLPAGRTGAASLPPGLGVGPAFAFACAHYAAVLLHWAPGAALGREIEPVHQMRVALRRLRSLEKLFRRAVPPPGAEPLFAALRSLGQSLGPARDWDVFLAGVGRSVAEAHPRDARVRRLLAAAAGQRDEAYTALRQSLADVRFRRIGIGLAVFAQSLAQADPAADDTLRPFAASALGRRWKRLTAPGASLAGLADTAIHDLRLEAKRMRYAVEFFAPLFDRKATARMLRRLSETQEQLGHLNDTTVAADLLTRLGPHGRGYAGGLVAGFVAARALGARAAGEEAWRRLRRLEPLWK